MPEALREEAHSLFMELSTVMKEGAVHCLPRAGAEQAGKGQLSDGGPAGQAPLYTPHQVLRH